MYFINNINIYQEVIGYIVAGFQFTSSYEK